MLSNLLDNALKYTLPAGRIRIAVRAEGSNAIIEVKDEGDGINEALIGRVFDLFVQGERTLAREKGGLGIGLTMAKRLVELHGGTIVASSDGEGRGATFTVSLPLIDRPPPSALRSRTPVVGPKPRILLVEDNADARESLAALLRECGHDVHAVETGEQAIPDAMAWTPDVALIDIGLPGIDGYEVAFRLRALPALKRILLIALTGYGSPEDQRRSMASGFDAHFIKPLDLRIFDALLAEHVAEPAKAG